MNVGTSYDPATSGPVRPLSLLDHRWHHSGQPTTDLRRLRSGATPPTEHLPLGRANLAETRDIRTLQPGVTFHLREAINLDGNGSATMVAGNTVLNTPSDATGERPVGDALIIAK